MGSYNDWSNLMQSRPLPFYLNSETPEAVSGDVLPYQTQAEADPYTQAAEAGKTLMQNVVDEISGVSEQKRRLSVALAKMQAIKESGTITQGNALDFNPAAKSAVEGLSEMTGVAPSERVVDRLTKLQSPVLRPDSAFGWGNEAAGLLADTAQTGLAAADMAAFTPIVGRRAAASLGNEIGTFGGDLALNKPAKGSPDWFTGMEGKPKFEIDDSSAVINKSFGDNAAEMIGEYTRVYEHPPKLQEFLEHPTLYDQYPELKNVTLTTSNSLSKTRGSFDEISNTIALNPSLSNSEMKDTLTHEIQHWVQKKEGFARGGSPEMMAAQFSDQYRQWKNLANAARYDELRKQYGADDVLNRLNIELQEEADVFGKVHVPILGTTAQDIKALADKYGAEELRNQFNSIYQQNPNILTGKLSPDRAFRGYQNLAGEIEARDAANRRTWPMDLRRTMPPDIRKDAIVRMGDDGAAEQAVQRESGGTVEDLTKADLLNYDTASKYKKVKAGDLIGDFEVGEKIPNQSSIESSGIDEVLPGVRIVPMSVIETTNPKDLFYAADDIARTKQLAEQIKANKRIDPLIVGIDEKGAYILEGGHRLGALHILGVKEFPALIAIEDTAIRR